MITRRLRSFFTLWLGLWCVVGQAQVRRPFVSTELSPIRDLHVTVRDGNDVFGVLRVPPGEGPFPAVIVLHPGVETLPHVLVRRFALGATGERLLAAGYATIWMTYRNRLEDPHALWDALAVVDFVKEMDEVDGDSVVLYGCSSGGALALDVAGETNIAAAVVEEPALVLFTGIFGANREFLLAGDFETNLLALQREREHYFTDALRESTQEKIRRINSPIFFGYGQQGVIRSENLLSWDLGLDEYWSERQAADVPIEHAVYPGESHCFGIGGDTEGGQTFFDDMNVFLQRHVPTQPKPIEGGTVFRYPGELAIYE